MWCIHRMSPPLSLSVLTDRQKRDERVLVVWADDLDSIIPLAHDFENKLIKLVWRSRVALSVISNGTTGTTPSIPPSTPYSPPSGTGSFVNLTEKEKEPGTGRWTNTTAVIPDRDRPPPPNKPKSFSPFSYFRTSRKTNTETGDVGDVEKAPIGKTPRPIRLLAPLYGGLGAALALCKFL
jgi:hypothetical protein